MYYNSGNLDDFAIFNTGYFYQLITADLFIMSNSSMLKQ